MNNPDALAARQVYDDMRATFAQLTALQRMLDDFRRRLTQTDDFEKWRALDREFNQLQSEWGLVHDKFITLNQRLNVLVSRFISQLPNRQVAVTDATDDGKAQS
jgi:hypothetical protein